VYGTADMVMSRGDSDAIVALALAHAGLIIEANAARHPCNSLLKSACKRTIRVSKSAVDKTREVRQPKTKNSVALLPMPSALVPRLGNYLDRHYKPNPAGILFTNRAGTRSMKRESLVQYVLKPILRRLGIPEKRFGLHGFRHGLATEPTDKAVPLPVLRQQMRHADVRTTLRIYRRVIPESQREAMEKIRGSISTVVPISTAVGTELIANKARMVPGVESDSVAPLIQRNLLIFRGATNARSATLAQVGYTFGTHIQNFDSWWRPN